MAENKIPIMITLHERDLLLNETTAIGEVVLSKIRVAEVVGDKIRFSILSDDLDLLLDDLVFEANSASDENMVAFDRLLGRLNKVYNRHAGKDEPPAPLPEVNEEFARLKHQELFSFGRRPMQQYLDEPTTALGGLTPKQALALFRDGWWGPEPLIRLNTDLGLADFAASRFLKNVRIFLRLLQETGGASLTVKGNLTRKFVAQILERMEMESEYKEEIYRYNKIINEMDVWPLHILRLVCTLAKLVRKYKKRLVATKLGLSLLAEERAGQLCAKLFDAHFTEFSLAYLDGLPDEYGTVQDFFPYSLFRLSLLDADKEYAISDLPAVLLPPSLVEDLDSFNEHVKAEHYIQHRFLRPLEKFGLLTIRRTKEPGDFIEKERYVQKTALFERFIKTT